MGVRLLLAIFLGGAAGGLARAALERAWPADGHSWPWVTFAVNIAGTALLAYVITRLGHRPYARPLLGIGLCGALTTFSTLQLEALELAHNDHASLGATYAVTSIAAGLLAAYGRERRSSRPRPRGVTAVVWIGVGDRERRRCRRALPAPHGRPAAVGEQVPVRDAGRERRSARSCSACCTAPA